MVKSLTITPDLQMAAINELVKDSGDSLYPSDSVDWSIIPYTKSLCDQLPVRTHTETEGLIPG